MFARKVRRFAVVLRAERDHVTPLDARFAMLLKWALAFFVFALIAAVFGFGGIAAGAASAAKIIFYVFVALFVLSILANALRGASA